MAGGGVPEMGAVSIPAPNYAALVNQTQGPFAQILQGLNAFLASQQQRKLTQTALQQTQAQTQQDQARSNVEMQQATAMQQSQALQLYQQFGTLGLKTPSLTGTPQYRARMEQLAQAAGMPSPYDSGGQFQGDQFKQPIDPKALAAINEMPPGPAKTSLLNQYSGVDQGLYTEGPIYTGRELAEINRASALGVHYQNADAVAKGREEVDYLRYQLQKELNPARKAELQARVNEMDAQATRANAGAQLDLTRAQNLSAELQAGLPQLRALAMQYRLNPGSGPALIKQYTSLLSKAEQAKEAMQDADSQYETAQTNGLSGATLQPYASKKAGAYAKYQAAVIMLQNVYSDLQSQVGASSGLRVGMGAKSVGVGGPLTLPPPPTSLLERPGTTASSITNTPGYINPDALPPGTRTGVGPDGNTYYNVGGQVYDAQGLLVGPGGANP